VKAEWYEKQGSAEHVSVVGETNEPKPLPGEVRIRVAFSGLNPGDCQKRRGRVRPDNVLPAHRSLWKRSTGEIVSDRECCCPNSSRRRIREYASEPERLDVHEALSAPLPGIVSLARAF